MKLFCLPYAGATSMIYLRLRAYSDIVKQCEIVPIDIPGRGQRMSEPFCQTMDEAAEDLAKQLTGGMIEKTEKYAIYAHSMGCILAYELMYKMEERGYALPAHIFFSGKNAPDVPLYDKGLIEQLSDDEIIDRIINTDGLEYAEIYKNKTIANLFIPILRADVKILEEYVCQKKKHKLPVDIIYFFSIDDPELDIEQVRRWQDFITGRFQLYSFQGGHFFLLQNIEPIVEIMLRATLEAEEDIPY